MSSASVTLAEEIADLKREIKMREWVYPGQLNGITDPKKREELRKKQEHQLACSKATLARLEALVPKQSSLFP